MYSFSESAVGTSQGSDLVPGLQEALGGNSCSGEHWKSSFVFWSKGEIRADTFSQWKDHTNGSISKLHIWGKVYTSWCSILQNPLTVVSNIIDKLLLAKTRKVSPFVPSRKKTQDTTGDLRQDKSHCIQTPKSQLVTEQSKEYHRAIHLSWWRHPPCDDCH